MQREEERMRREEEELAKQEYQQPANEFADEPSMPDAIDENIEQKNEPPVEKVEEVIIPSKNEETEVNNVNIIYKVQVLARMMPLPNYSDYFSKEYKLENVIEEKYDAYGKSYYQYTIAAGGDGTLKDALKLKREIVKKGVSDAWIVGYKGKDRVIPPNESIVH
jgi:hypothetical protein